MTRPPYHWKEQERPGIAAGNMSLRDWFAGQAIHGFLPGRAVEDAHFMDMAQSAYRVADAMLKAREQ